MTISLVSNFPPHSPSRPYTEQLPEIPLNCHSILSSLKNSFPVYQQYLYGENCSFTLYQPTTHWFHSHRPAPLITRYISLPLTFISCLLKRHTPFMNPPLGMTPHIMSTAAYLPTRHRAFRKKKRAGIAPRANRDPIAAEQSYQPHWLPSQ